MPIMADYWLTSFNDNLPLNNSPWLGSYSPQGWDHLMGTAQLATSVGDTNTGVSSGKAHLPQAGC